VIEPNAELFAQVRRRERELLTFAGRFVLSNAARAEVRRTRHYREWFFTPMNYARIMEVPITEILLDAKPGERVLDVSSPKILALHLMAHGGIELTVADLEDYFVADFEAFTKLFPGHTTLDTFDASAGIPYPDGYFDKVFSVSVLEHIAGDGDRAALEEILRVLRPGGRAVITLPVLTTYYEEWMTRPAYWRTVENDEGRVFFQRRYDAPALQQLVAHPLAEWDYLLIAERPLKPIAVREDGLMLHNSYLVETIGVARFLKRLRRLKVPFSDWAAERIASGRCHYLTRDWTDPNIRQVAVEIRRKAN